MSRYRRLFVPGGTYFFTVALADPSATLLTQEIGLLRHVYAAVTREHPVRSLAFVVLPDHLHCIWTLPPGDCDFPVRWKKIKSGFSRHLPAAPVSRSKAERGEKGLWQRRYWEHAIRDASDLDAHVDLIRRDPVTHGLVAAPQDWPYGSIAP